MPGQDAATAEPLSPAAWRALEERLAALMSVDERRLHRRLEQVARAGQNRSGSQRRDSPEQIVRDIEAAEGRVGRRQAAVPALGFPAELPITDRKDEIVAALAAHQVVIVAGETGSGKSTQLPKMCLELGRGIRGWIGHTQPRRLAARTVAERVAQELGSEIGGAVGYTVRFTDHVGEGTLVKVMTDGILLAEIQRDRMLDRYDTLIIDEAHERSLNIDFILGYLKQLLPRRPDLKVIVTSATIDTARFSEHFDAPVIEVSGRTYPVEVRYRPLDPGQGGPDGEDDSNDEEPRDQTRAVCDAVEELCHEGPGDILVFLSGEREIRDTADAANRLGLRDTEIVPLYARLSSAEQHRVFEGHAGRRVILATNVAETSLTVPGIRYVVDPGTARVSRYNRRTKVQRLPIESVSQASADQRAGRCGRVAPGICIRLYSEEDFAARPAFTDPEILRTNLASVILQMAAIGLGDVAAFPFVEPPDARSIADGVALLQELGALDPDAADAQNRLTPLGRRLAQMPLDPRLGRMVLAAADNGCVDEVMVIAAALSIQDPRERPADKREAAAEMHNRFTDPDSDFMTYHRLWRYLREEQKQRSSNQFRKLCRAEYLNYLRVREWQDIYSQLRQTARMLGIARNLEAGDPGRIHLSLLAGLLSHVGLRQGDTSQYLGARNARFSVAPGSALFRKPPRWVMVGELVETDRLRGRVAARIQPEWAERLGGHLLKRSYGDPWWDAGRAAAVANERVTLYGLPIVASRRVAYGGVDTAVAREMFIRHALVGHDWSTHHRFVDNNRRLVDELRALEDRARRRDLVVGEDAQYDFYDQRIPAEVTSGRHFDVWWKRERATRPELLTFDIGAIVAPDAGPVSLADFPDRWRQGDLELALSYRFEPGAEDDGVTVDIPLALLNRVADAGFDWQVPGLRHDLVTTLIRSLPKPIRRNFVPVPDSVRAFLDRAGPNDGPLLRVLERELPRMTGDPVPAHSWQLDRVSDSLRMRFRIVGDDGRAVAAGRDLEALRRRLGATMRSAVAEAARTTEQAGVRTWTFGRIERVVETDWTGAAGTGGTAKAYPAVVDDGDSVSLRVLASEADQDDAMWAGTRRLLLLGLPSPARALPRLLKTRAKLALAHAPHAGIGALLDDCIAATVDDLMAEHGGVAWDGEGFEALRVAVGRDLGARTLDVVNRVAGILTAVREVDDRLGAMRAPALRPVVADVRSQLGRLVYPGFVSAGGVHRLADIVRYLTAIERRLDKVGADPARDAGLMQRVQALEARYDRVIDALPEGPVGPEVAEVEWMIQELRVSYFAQVLGTGRPVSDKRILDAIGRLLA